MRGMNSNFWVHPLFVRDYDESFEINCVIKHVKLSNVVDTVIPIWKQWGSELCDFKDT